jgi:hypothetical protein
MSGKVIAEIKSLWTGLTGFERQMGEASGITRSLLPSLSFLNPVNPVNPVKLFRALFRP